MNPPSLLNSLIKRLEEYFSVSRVSEVLSAVVLNVLLAVCVFALFYVAWRLISRVMTSRLRDGVDRTTAAMLETVIKTLVLGIGFVVALNTAGVQTAALLASLGVLSLTIGFALKDTLSNIISGFLVFVDRPFTIDDLVEIDGQYGRVDRITLRTTRIITVDGRMLAVPNSIVMNKTVTSYTNFPHLRIDIAVMVAVTENLDRIREIMLGLIANNPDYMTEPKPRMVVVKLNDYNVALELQAWLRDERNHTQQRFDLRENVFKALTAANVDMPLETIQLAP
ncbi:MAG: mechanosensitive ion channel family protein, partial [Betaproteobacteria bacterium]